MLTGIKRRFRQNVLILTRRISNSLQTQTCHVKGHEISLRVESEIEEFRADTYAIKEPETLEWIERYLQPGDVLYDVGANIGLYSLFAAKSSSGECKIYAFEPEALNYARLNRNIHLNDFSAVVVPCCLAIADRLTFDSLYLHPDIFGIAADNQDLISGSALHSFGVTEDYKGKAFQPIHVQGTVGVSLDHLWQVWGLDFPNHIKIDVDGLEEKVIAGAARTLEDRRLKSVLVEISRNKGDADPILSRLTQVGFTRITDFSAHSKDLLKGTPHEDCLNSVFVRGVQ